MPHAVFRWLAHVTRDKTCRSYFVKSEQIPNRSNSVVPIPISLARRTLAATLGSLQKSLSLLGTCLARVLYDPKHQAWLEICRAVSGANEGTSNAKNQARIRSSRSSTATFVRGRERSCARPPAEIFRRHHLDRSHAIKTADGWRHDPAFTSARLSTINKSSQAALSDCSLDTTLPRVRKTPDTWMSLVSLACVWGITVTLTRFLPPAFVNSCRSTCVPSPEHVCMSEPSVIIGYQSPPGVRSDVDDTADDQVPRFAVSLTFAYTSVLHYRERVRMVSK
nr:hypothetical protein CFP56_78512 [Quercus suber]